MTIVAILVVIGFSGIVFDFGVNMVGRNQAQNTADASALAGAIAWAFDEPDTETPEDGGAVVESIKAASDRNLTLGSTDHATTYAFGDCPPGIGLDEDDRCVRVNVFRNGEEFSSPLQMFFGPAFGLGAQGTRATATAIGQNANGSNCLKPWLIPDKFEDVDEDGQFSEGDIYTNPGWTTADIGTELVISPGTPSGAIAPSDFFQLTQGNEFPPAVLGCTLQAGFGQTVEVFPGASVGLQRNAVEALIANNDGNPVTVVIGMFDPEAFYNQDRQSGKYELEIVNMMAFRLVGMDGKWLKGTIVAGPGDLVPGADDAPEGASFLKVIRLVQ